jgi:5-methylcytosine-specific restriction protein A
MAERNPPWSRDELILALDLYLRNRLRLPERDDTAISGLSSVLQSLAGAAAGRFASYRNSNSVYMKLANFRALDPRHIEQGRRGLTRGGRLDSEVWEEFANKPDDVARIAAAIRSNIAEGLFEDEDFALPLEAPEGRLLASVHQRRERNAKLVDTKKMLALKQHGRLSCEACGFDFAAFYGDYGFGLIEAHHVQPLHTLLPGSVTKLEDLVLVCSNCHRIIHAKTQWLTLEQLKALIANNRDGQATSAKPL